MATVVDELVVTLGLDPSAFTKGQKEAADSLVKTRQAANTTAKEMQAGGKTAAEFFGSIKNEFLGLLAVGLGGKGLESFIKDTTKNLADLGRAALNIGMPVEELSAFEMMIRRNGGSAEAAAASFQKLTDAAESWNRFGQGSEYASVMSVIGAHPGETGIQVYEDLLKYATAHPGEQGIQDTRRFGQMLGLDPSVITTLLLQATKGGLDQFKKEMQESYDIGVPNKAMTDRMMELQSDWVKLQETAEQLGNVIVDKTEPALDGILKWAQKMAQEGVKDVENPPTPDVKSYTQPDPQFRGPGALFDQVWQSIFGAPTPSTSSGYSTAPLPSDIEREVRQKAELAGLDPDHMVALARAEGGTGKISPAGAIGTMQLMPGTAKEVGVDPNDPHANITGGMAYYQKLLRRYNGNYKAADAAYNAGPNRVDASGYAVTGDPSGLPRETQRYIDTINSPPKAGPRASRGRPTKSDVPFLKPGELPPGYFRLPRVGPNVPAPPPLPPTGSSSEVHIGQITVHGVKDAAAVGPGIRTALQGNSLINQANRGLS